MKKRKGLSFEQVKSCLKLRAWNNFPLSKLKEKVEEAKECLSSVYESTLVYNEETRNHILLFFKPFCTDVKRKKLTVQDMLEKLLEEKPPQKQNSRTREYDEARIRVWKEIRTCFAGDKSMYDNMLFG